MSLDDSQVIDKIAHSGDGLEPRPGWQDDVRRRIRAESVVLDAPRRISLWLPGLVLAGAIVAAFFIVDGQRAAEKERAEEKRVALMQNIAELRRAIRAAQIDIDNAMARMDAAFDELEAAQTEEARAIARQARETAKNELNAKREELQRLREKAAKVAKSKSIRKRKKNKATISRCAKSNDPLCGL